MSYVKMTAEQKKDYQIQKKKELDKKLSEGVQAIFEDGRFEDYLRMQACFHQYSVNNTILILLQNPEATRVAGIKTWNKLKRHLVPDAQAIRIYAHLRNRYATRKKVNDDGEEEDEKISWNEYTTVCVYDISQTVSEDGSDELPGEIVHTLKGDVEHYDEFMEKLQSAAGISFEYEDIPGGANGYYSPTENRIVLQKGMSQKQTLKTAIHETAHSKLHFPGSAMNSTREIKEIQAESCAYLVCAYFGIEDVGSYSFGYIAGWSSDKTEKERLQVLGTIKGVADELIDAIEA